MGARPPGRPDSHAGIIGIAQDTHESLIILNYFSAL